MLWDMFWSDPVWNVKTFNEEAARNDQRGQFICSCHLSKNLSAFFMVAFNNEASECLLTALASNFCINIKWAHYAKIVGQCFACVDVVNGLLRFLVRCQITNVCCINAQSSRQQFQFWLRNQRLFLVVDQTGVVFGTRGCQQIGISVGEECYTPHRWSVLSLISQPPKTPRSHLLFSFEAAAVRNCKGEQNH